MTFREKSERAAIGKALDVLLGYVKKDPDANIGKLVDFAEKYVGSIFPGRNFDAMRKGAQNPDNIWVKLTKSILNDTDKNIVKKMLLAFGLGAGVHGTKKVRENREKLKKYILENANKNGEFIYTAQSAGKLYNITQSGEVCKILCIR